jgi:hypothetical protein
MSSWGNNDNSANAPLWAAMTENLTPNSANVTALFDNTTANNVAVTLADGSVRQGQKTVGLFAIDANEAQVADANPTGGYMAHTGWNLVTTGQGGRAGRVQTECLVALANVISDADGQLYPNVAISLVLSTTALAVTHNVAYANVATVSVTPTLTGNTAANLTYQWQVNNNVGGSWVNVANGTPANTNYTGGTTSTLGIEPADTTANNYVYRVIITAADEGVSKTSSNVSIVIA